ncbi:MAG: hypothetical protein STSR0004_00930 [Peptococcaceae bacterium]
MIIWFLLFFLLLLTYYLATYCRWAWQHNHKRGAVGIIIVALFTLVLPVVVWAYHNWVR